MGPRFAWWASSSWPHDTVTNDHEDGFISKQGNCVSSGYQAEGVTIYPHLHSANLTLSLAFYMVEFYVITFTTLSTSNVSHVFVLSYSFSLAEITYA